MKLSLIPLNFNRMMREGTMTMAEWIEMAVELGLEGTEVYEGWVKTLDAAGLAKLAGDIHDAGLEASMFTSESDFSNKDKRAESIAHAKHSVDAALIFGANIVRLTAASHGIADRELVANTDREVIMKTCADGLRGCLDYAEEKGVMMALEDHPLIGTNVEDFMRVLELVNDDRLKVNLDTANVPRDTTVQLAKLVKDRVVHFHVSELLEGKHGIVVGKGDVDIKGVFSVLKGNGYDGWVSIEALTGDKDDLQFSVDHVREAWAGA